MKNKQLPGLVLAVLGMLVTTAILTHGSALSVDSFVTTTNGEVQINLSEVAVSGYIMVLLRNNSSTWQAGIVLSIDEGEIVHYVIGDPSDPNNSWNTDTAGNHHTISGQFVVFTLSEFTITSETEVAVLSILSGHYDWIPDYYENAVVFVPFEPYLNGLTTIPNSAKQGETSTLSTSDPSDVNSPTDSTSVSTKDRGATTISGSKSSQAGFVDSLSAGPIALVMIISMVSLAVLLRSKKNAIL